MKKRLMILALFLTYLLLCSGCEISGSPTQGTEAAPSAPSATAPEPTQETTQPIPTTQPHVHSWNPQWERDETTHRNTCECGEVMMEGEHTFSDWGTEVKATCTREGKRSQICKMCHYQIVHVIPAKGHNFVDNQEVAATCTEFGKTGGIYCENCGKIEELQKIVIPKGHCYENDVCTVCREKRGKDGMVFTLNADGASYTVSGDASFKGDRLVIPGTYNGLPVTHIADKGFQFMQTIKTLVIADGIKNIGWASFSGCTNIERIAIAPSVERTNYETFERCGTANHRLSIYVSSLEQWLGAQMGHASCGAERYQLYIDSVLAQDVVLPSSITELCGAAFRRCGSIRSVTVPENVTVIGSYAFGDCANLRTVALSEGLKKIDTFAFFSCTALQHLQLPDSLATIPMKAFMGCTNLKTLVIPAGLKKIGDYAFSTCHQLTVFSKSESKPSCWDDEMSIPIYWGDQWHYVDGVPTPNQP